MSPSEEEEGYSVVEAEVPMSEMADFTTVMRSMTQGRGSFTMKFDKYEEVPAQLAQKIIEAHKAEEEE